MICLIAQIDLHVIVRYPIVGFNFTVMFVIQVTDGIHVAIGYAVANSILIEAPGGAIIVDTTENVNAARDIMNAFRNLTDAPIKAIIYTHNHVDHTHGASVCTK